MTTEPRTFDDYRNQHPHLNPEHVGVALALRPRNSLRHLLEIVATVAVCFAVAYGLLAGGWALLMAGWLVKGIACFVALGFAVLCLAAAMRASQTQDYTDHP